ncbi:tetratricopeptide repeat protein [Eisenibacter elegans]|jgi:tetratricopeptide (TPR) repeat protein|uniref:tetratricopeptide repeat protein n=1 Tax=Eisenibacter elegans TaxID=997 RepID=UPI00041EB2DB|nr:tetratricopeptide repeat protein [Eisenibacter elegans]
MIDDFDSRDETEETVVRFEQMLRQEEFFFFDVETYERIIEYYREREEYETALQACEMALSQYPFSNEIKFEKAQVLASLDEFEDALELIEQLEVLYPQDKDLIFLKGNVLYLCGQYTEAIESLEQALPFAQDKDEIYFRIGYVYAQSEEQMPQAISYFQKALRENIAHEAAALELAFCLDFIDDFAEGVRFYEEVINENPYAHYAWYNLGLLHANMEQYGQALQALSYAVLIQEDFAAAHYAMGHAYMNNSDYREAQQTYLLAIDHTPSPDPEMLCCLGAAYEKDQQYSPAIRYYNQALQLDPTYADAWFGVGACLFYQEKWFESLHFLRKTVTYNDDNDLYWLVLANAEYQIGNTVASFEAYMRASEINPTNPEVWLNWSLLCFEQGEEDKAVQLLSEGIEECPEEALLYYRMAAYLIDAGKYKQAFSFLENALTLDFDKHTVLFDFFTSLDVQKALFKIIDQYRQDHS